MDNDNACNSKKFIKARLINLQGILICEKFLDLPEDYEILQKQIKEIFTLNEDENFFYSICYKDNEGDYIEISNSSDYEATLQSLENSQKNYLKIKIFKKEHNKNNSIEIIPSYYIHLDSDFSKIQKKIMENNNLINDKDENKDYESCQNQFDNIFSTSSSTFHTLQVRIFIISLS